MTCATSLTYSLNGRVGGRQDSSNPNLPGLFDWFKIIKKFAPSIITPVCGVQQARQQFEALILPAPFWPRDNRHHRISEVLSSTSKLKGPFG